MLNLYKAFSVIKNEQDFYNFLSDLCTPTEIRELSERWNIAQLLHSKTTQRSIISKLDCSQATVSRVARFLNDEKYGGYRNVLAKIYPHSKSTS
jgi:TrpR-related protein YerC/YecD